MKISDVHSTLMRASKNQQAFPIRSGAQAIHPDLILTLQVTNSMRCIDEIACRGVRSYDPYLIGRR